MSESAHYKIPKEPGGRGALALALVVHLALIAFLWIGVSWQSSEHGGVEAEIWDTQYREAAPRAAEPEPVQEEAPRPKPEPEPKTEAKPTVAKADIALEQEKKRQEARQKSEEAKRKKDDADKKKKDEADKRKQDLADQKAREKLRAEEMRRIAGAAGTGGSGTAARSTGNNRIDPNYSRQLGMIIRRNTVFVTPATLDGNPAVEYAIELWPDGSLRSEPKRIKPSGIAGFDEAVLNAIRKSRFPPDGTGKYPPSIRLYHKLKD